MELEGVPWAESPPFDEDSALDAAAPTPLAATLTRAGGA